MKEILAYSHKSEAKPDDSRSHTAGPRLEELELIKRMSASC